MFGSPGIGSPLVGNPKPTTQIDCEPKQRLSPITKFWAPTIGAVYWNLLQSYGSARTRTGKCLEDNQGAMLKAALGDLLGDPPGGKGGKRDARIGSMRSKGNSALERGRFKRTGQCSVASGRNRFDRRTEVLEQRGEELECLHRLVRDLELEARGRHRRRDHEERGEGSASVGGHHEARSH